MKLSEANLKKIQKYFATQKDIVVVYLYGSFAKGTTHKKSDLDFGILFNPPIKTYYRLGEIINDLRDLGLSAEPDVRDVNLDQEPLYLRNVVQGKLIFTRDQIKRIRFEVATMSSFRDTENLRSIQLYYMKKRLKEGTYGFRY